MSLVLPVKLSKVTNLSDARYGAGMGVQFMGFCMSPDNPHRVSPEEFTAITGWLSGPEYVGEFDEGTPFTTIVDTAKLYEVYWVEIHDEELVQSLQNVGLKVILTVDVAKLASIKAIPDYLLVYSYADSFSVNEHLNMLKNINKKVPVLLASGLEAGKILSWHEASALSGVAIAGGEEIRPGYKDFDEIADILEVLEDHD
jgi:phosphoribosylanthranilate isomerase